MKQDILHYNLFALHQTNNSYFVYVYVNTATKITNNTKTMRKLFFFLSSKRYSLSPVRNSVCFTQPQWTLPCSEEPYDKKSYQQQIGKSCLIFFNIGFHVIFQSVWDSTVSRVT